MGWDYEHGTTIRKLKQDLNRATEAAGGKVLGEATKGSVWYRAIQTKDGSKFIAIYLMSRGKYGAGYKAMTEDMHPFYYDCPAKLLELTGRSDLEMSKGAREWRGAVSFYHVLVASGVEPREAHRRVLRNNLPEGARLA